jgi:hypothetical protein
MRINRAEGNKLFPAEMPEDLTEGATLFRNRDQAFERALEKESAERRCRSSPCSAETDDGFALTLTDEDGINATVNLKNNKIRQGNCQECRAGHCQAEGKLGKFGNTMFAPNRLNCSCRKPGSCRSARSTHCAAKPPKSSKLPASRPSAPAARRTGRQSGTLPAG